MRVPWPALVLLFALAGVGLSVIVGLIAVCMYDESWEDQT